MLSDWLGYSEYGNIYRLNPCSNGICSLTSAVIVTTTTVTVLILVLMEYAL